MKSTCLACATAILTLSATPTRAQSTSGAADIPVTLDAETQERLGVATVTLEARSLADSVEAIVRAVDPAPLVMLDAELTAAAAAAAASASALERTAGLAAQNQSASQQALEAAQAQAAADAATLTMLQRRLGLEWGTAIAGLSSEARAALVSDMATGRAALLRADAPQRPEGLEGRVLIQLTADAPPIPAETLGLTPSAEPRMQTIGLYCLVRGETARALRSGRVLPGRIETAATVTGSVLPRAALVRLDGRAWAYVRTGEGSFVRRAVDDGRPVDAGWFVTRGFAPGTTVVVRGAGSLVAVERGGEAGEED